MKFDNHNDLIKQEEAVNIKKIICQLLGHWHLFLLFGALGLGGAYGYTQFTKPTFSVSSSMLIPQESTGFDMKELFNVDMIQNAPKINNQIEILKSSFTIKKTLLTLNWRTSWCKKKTLIWNGLYRTQPFDVQEPDNFINPSRIKIYIKPTNNNYFTVTVDETIKYKGVKTAVNFEAKGEFEHPFKNKYFNFILRKKGNNFDTGGEKYYFVFNDLKHEIL